MKKTSSFSRFNVLSITYLVISFCFISRLPFLFNWTNFLLVELSYVIISAFFSFFILSIIYTFFKKIKTQQLTSNFHFRIKLNLFHVLALTIWLLEILIQLYHSLSGILGQDFAQQTFLNDEILNDLLITQLSITIYLLVFLITTFILGLGFAKSKTIIIKFSKIETYFFWSLSLKDSFKIYKKWVLVSVHHLLYFLNNSDRKNFWNWEVLDLKIKTIKSIQLKDTKKQTTPPLSFF